MKMVSVVWAEIRERVKNLNPELFAIIEKLSPDAAHGFYLAHYAYGETVIHRGKLEGIDAEDLSYSPIPLMLQMQKTNEIFVSFGERVVPLNLVAPGELYGVFEVASRLSHTVVQPVYSATAGARSTFFSTKISDALGNKRLAQTFGPSIIQPKTLTEQFQNFKTIAQTQLDQEEAWISQILIFKAAWFAHEEDDPAWQGFYNYLFRQGFQQVQLLHFKNASSMIWEDFSNAVQSRNLKPSPYTVDTVKQLILIANNFALGFKPANGDENLLPSELIEAVYRNVYLFKYAPMIMAPYFLKTTAENCGLFYSLSYPTLIEGSPALKTPGSLMSEIRDLQRLMQMIQNLFLQNVRFEFYHSDEDQLKDIENSDFILERDAAFQNLLAKEFKGLPFSTHGTFFRGAVRIVKI